MKGLIDLKILNSTILLTLQ